MHAYTQDFGLKSKRDAVHRRHSSAVMMTLATQVVQSNPFGSILPFRARSLGSNYPSLIYFPLMFYSHITLICVKSSSHDGEKLT